MVGWWVQVMVVKKVDLSVVTMVDRKAQLSGSCLVDLMVELTALWMVGNSDK
jgi:hypothetical protein